MFLPARLTALFAGASLLAAIGAGSREKSHPQLTPPAAGPATTNPVGKNEARDAEELARWLEDPNGPSEITLGPRAYHGDFRVRHRVALRGQKGAELVGTGRGTVLSIEAEGSLVEDVVVRHSGRRHTQEDAGIKASAPNIVIRRVSVRDALFGISLGPCKGCLLERASVQGDLGEHELRGDAIKLWEASDSRVQHCVVENGRDLVVWYSRRVTLSDNWVSHSRYGAHFMYAHDSLVKNSRFVDNVVGVFVMYSAGVKVEDSVLAGARGAAGIGVGFKESDAVSLARNWLVANTTGIYLDRTPRAPQRPAHFDGNVLALNQTAVSFHSSERGVFFHDNDFRRNHVAVEVEGGGHALGVEFERNYWSDYLGYDLNRDSVGDVAYEVKRLASALTETHPSLRLFDGTLAMGLIDVMARAVPVFSAERLLSDSSPRMAEIEAKP
ncbi:MAG: nitrous oxide reductase family maturation protein NosD [Myxococcota bacterium]